MNDLILPAVIGLAICGMIVGLVLAAGRTPTEQAEQRLDHLTGHPAASVTPEAGMLLRPEKIDLGNATSLLPRLDSLSVVYEQADVGLPFQQFLLIDLVLSAVGGGVAFYLRPSPVGLAIGAAVLGIVPWLWLFKRKSRRIKQFVAQMPDALELVGRALRAGHSLSSGLCVVAEEMAPPISTEFGRVFEEQNLGIPVEDALRGLSDRIPVMDVRFFVTAVVIQRSCGGDLAEILDKIGRLIRERFQILGQVQALTAEGRLSGIVLLALPPTLLAATYFLNPSYCGMLFNTPQGTKLLAAAAALQILGALAIKKIITIKI